MKSIILALTLFMLGTVVDAQVVSIWKGGKPGRPNDWNCPANWSNNRVPDEFSNVIIPLSNSAEGPMCVITTPDCEVASLRIYKGAVLTILPDGELNILNPDYCDDVSRIVVYGTLVLSEGPSKDKELVVEAKLH